MGAQSNRAKYVRLALTTVFVVCMIASNIFTSKQIELPFGLSATCGIVVFPIVYVLSDVFSECYGYRWSRVTCYMAFASNAIMSILTQIAIAIPPSGHWDGQEAFATTLGSTPRVLVASLLAYLVGDLLNDVVFRRMKSRGDNGFCARALSSSVVGEIADSLVFYPIALLGALPIGVVVRTAVVEVCLKLAYEAMVLPLTARIVKIVGNQT